jgi:ComF family protein
MERATPPFDPGPWRGEITDHPAAAWPSFWYEGKARQAVLAIKFHGLWAGAEDAGRLMAIVAVEERFRFDAVVPVPLHPRRQRERGFNQAELLARPVATALDIPLRTDVLRRVRPTAHQSLIKDRERRAANVAGAFLADGDPAGLRILLIDDVSTTGATIRTCANALLSAGASGVASLVFAQER